MYDYYDMKEEIEYEELVDVLNDISELLEEEEDLEELYDELEDL